MSVTAKVPTGALTRLQIAFPFLDGSVRCLITRTKCENVGVIVKRRFPGEFTLFGNRLGLYVSGKAIVFVALLTSLKRLKQVVIKVAQYYQRVFYERNEHAEAFFAAAHADIRYRGGRAYYSEEADYIQMPCIESFRAAEGFWATLAHECVHSTKHSSRLGRDLGRKTWGDEGYAREELVAELGAAFLCAGLELTPEVRDDHAAYLQSWVTVLKNDHRAIFQAVAYAQRAVDYLHELQQKPCEAAASAACTKQALGIETMY